MTDSGPEHNPFAPPDPSAPPSPPPPPPYAPQTWGQPQAWPQPPQWVPPPARTTSAPAVLALVTAVVALVPVALVLSIAALVRIKRRDQSGTGLVYAALAVCGVWSLLIVISIVVGVLGGFDAHSRGSVSVLPTTEVETCLDGGLNAVESCASTHDLELYFSPTLPDPVWPGTADVANAADSLCHEAFAGYVGRSYDDSELDYDFYAPTESEWLQGKHAIVCVIEPPDDLRTRSVKSSGR